MAKLVALDGYKEGDAGIPEIHAEGCKDIAKPVVFTTGKFAREILMTGESLEEIAATWYRAGIQDAPQWGQTVEAALADAVSTLRVMNCAKQVLKAVR
jgi:hypothetical protein